ncbi:MAG: cell envelope integrity protein TolA [Deltaproteobacteria bacterium]|nr:cell envelope integrity protein TolA [Deltaproteobacteria bacterium]MBI2974521.1 cell envelope integrity protein TolA [Deltaproteobacteria bacterium]
MHTRQDVPNVSRPVFYSAVAHILFIIILSLSPELRWPFGDRPLQMVWMELPRGTSEEIGTGLKESEALPKSTIQEQKDLLKQKEAEEPKDVMKETVKQAKPVKQEKKLTKEEKKMKAALAKIDVKLKKRVVQPEAAQIGASGEGYKYGTSDKPLRVPIDDPEYVKYQAMIRARIIQEWIIPMKLYELPEGQRPKARIVVIINESGEVVSTEWEQRSGDSSFDASCIRAIQRASPFDTPAEKLKWEAYNEGFLIEFDPRLKP